MLKNAFYLHLATLYGTSQRQVQRHMHVTHVLHTMKSAMKHVRTRGHISLHIYSYHYQFEEYAYVCNITIHIVLQLMNISLIGTEISTLNIRTCTYSYCQLSRNWIYCRPWSSYPGMNHVLISRIPSDINTQLRDNLTNAVFVSLTHRLISAHRHMLLTIHFELVGFICMCKILFNVLLLQDVMEILRLQIVVKVTAISWNNFASSIWLSAELCMYHYRNQQINLVSTNYIELYFC